MEKLLITEIKKATVVCFTADCTWIEISKKEYTERTGFRLTKKYEDSYLAEIRRNERAERRKNDFSNGSWVMNKINLRDELIKNYLKHNASYVGGPGSVTARSRYFRDGAGVRANLIVNNLMPY